MPSKDLNFRPNLDIETGIGGLGNTSTEGSQQETDRVDLNIETGSPAEETPTTQNEPSSSYQDSLASQLAAIAAAEEKRKADAAIAARKRDEANRRQAAMNSQAAKQAAAALAASNIATIDPSSVYDAERALDADVKKAAAAYVSGGLPRDVSKNNDISSSENNLDAWWIPGTKKKKNKNTNEIKADNAWWVGNENRKPRADLLEETGYRARQFDINERKRKAIEKKREKRKAKAEKKKLKESKKESKKKKEELLNKAREDRRAIFDYKNNNPEASSEEISNELGLNEDSVKQWLNEYKTNIERSMNIEREAPGVYIDKDSGIVGDSYADALYQSKNEYSDLAEDIANEILDDANVIETDENIPIEEYDKYDEASEYEWTKDDIQEQEENKVNPNSGEFKIYFGEDDVPLHKSSFEERKDRHLGFMATVLRNLRRGVFSLAGQKINENTGETVYSARFRQELSAFIDFFDISEEDYPRIFEAIQLFCGLSPDISGKTYWGGQASKLEISEEDAIWAMNQMVDNVIHGEGFPFRFIDQNHKIHGTTCFPIPFVSRELYKVFAKSNVINKKYETYDDFFNESLKEWNENIVGEINKRADPGQKVVLHLYALACAQTKYGYDDFGIDEAAYNLNVQSPTNPYLSEAMKDISRDDITSEIVAKTNKITRSNRKEAIRRIDKINRRDNGARSSSKSFVNTKDMKASPFETILKMLLTAERTARVANPGLLIGGISDKATGTAVAYGTAKMTFAMNGMREFAPLEGTYDFNRNEDVRKYLDAYAGIIETLGLDGINAFVETRQAPTPDNIKKFIEEYGIKNPSGKIQKGLNKLNGIIAKAFSGDWVLKRSDWNRFIDDYLIKQADNKRNGLAYVTPEQLLENLKNNPAETLVDMFSMDTSAIRALNMARQRTLAGTTLASERVSQFLKRHGFTETALGVVLNEYFIPFGIRATEKYIPFLNSMEMLAMRSKAYSRAKENNEDAKFFGSETTEELMSMELSQLLMSTDWRQALLIDLSGIGNKAVQALVISALINLAGFGNPDNPEKNKGMWDEYHIGEVPWRMMWWLDDTLTWAAPLAIAANAYVKNGNIEESWMILCDGMADMFGSLAPLDILQCLLNPDDVFLAAQTMLGDDSINPETYDTGTVAQGLIFGQLINNIVPNIPLVDLFIRNEFMTEDTPEINNWRRYTTDLGDNEDYTEPVGPLNAMARKATGKNYLLGQVFDFFTGGSNTKIDGIQGTGYTYQEQPMKKTTDPFQDKIKNFFDLRPTDKDDPQTVEAKPAEIQTKVDIVINLMNTYIERYGLEYAGIHMAANSIVLPYDIRYYTYKYLNSCISNEWNNFDSRDENGLLWDDSKPYNENKAYYDSEKDKVYDVVNGYKDLQKLIYSSDIPYRSSTYYLTKTNYQDYYIDDNKNYRTALDYTIDLFLSKFTGERHIEHKIEPYGDSRDAIELLGATDVKNKGTYDDQTSLAWQNNQFTNIDEIKELFTTMEIDPIIGYGMYEGQNIWDIATQNNAVFDENGDWSSDLVLGQRGWVPLDVSVDYKKYEDMKNDDYEWTGNLGDKGIEGSGASDDNTIVVLDENGEYVTYTKDSPNYGSKNYSKGNPTYGSSYNGYRISGSGSGKSSSYSSSSSAYNPRIYSVAKSINANRASSMNTQRPYSATSTYLRPNFATKGSREAYKRSDI